MSSAEVESPQLEAAAILSSLIGVSRSALPVEHPKVACSKRRRRGVPEQSRKLASAEARAQAKASTMVANPGEARASAHELAEQQQGTNAWMGQQAGQASRDPILKLPPELVGGNSLTGPMHAMPTMMQAIDANGMLVNGMLINGMFIPVPLAPMASGMYGGGMAHGMAGGAHQMMGGLMAHGIMPAMAPGMMHGMLQWPTASRQLTPSMVAPFTPGQPANAQAQAQAQGLAQAQAQAQREAQAQQQAQAQAQVQAAYATQAAGAAEHLAAADEACEGTAEKHAEGGADPPDSPTPAAVLVDAPTSTDGVAAV